MRLTTSQVICDYLEAHAGPATARRVALVIYEKIASLSTLPHRGRPGRAAGTRELIVTGLPYIVFYRIQEDIVEINRILHGAQDWLEN